MDADTIAPYRVGFIGLGVMGYQMAGHLAEAGHDVVVYNRTTTKAKRWVAEFGGGCSRSPSGLAAEREIVFACVGNDDDLRSVTLGDEGAFHGMNKGTVFVDHTTASANVARELDAKAQDMGLHFLDAPVSGGESGARNGLLSVMVGGDPAVFERCRRVINAYARSVVLLGPAGSGQLTKMVNQICIAGLLQGLSEGLHFAQQVGLDGDQVLEVIAKGAAQSWQMENRGPTMLRDEFEFGFAVDWMRKDLDICLDQSHQVGATLPITAIVNECYAKLQAGGGGRWDTSSLMRLLTNGIRNNKAI